MVGRFGMSEEIGFLAVLPQDGQAYGYSEVSERTRQRVDDEMRRVVSEAHTAAVKLLTDNRDRLESLTEALYQAETLEGPEAYAAAGLETPGDAEAEPEPAEGDEQTEPQPAQPPAGAALA